MWVAGKNHPLIHRGHRGHVCDKARLIVGNLLCRFRDADARFAVFEVLPDSGGVKQSAMACGLVAWLTGLPRSTAYRIERQMVEEGWQWNPEVSPLAGGAATSLPLAADNDVASGATAGGLDAHLPDLGQASSAAD